MPWINKEMCVGCQICVDECTVGAISMDENVAVIDQDTCIRCGVCHNVCPNDAVRHDGERIPEEVQSNMDWAKGLLAHEYYSHDTQKQKQLMERLQRYFVKNKKVMEKSLERLKILKNTKYTD
jgi:Fe-S-cluster-containing hydrogenase component 2